MAKSITKKIQLECVVCGDAASFETREDGSMICLKCNKEYPGGHDELMELNADLIEREKQAIVSDEINRMMSDFKSKLKKIKGFKVK